MANRRTTIEFPESLEPILDKFERTYGLKNVVAGGVLAFSRLSAEEREKIINELIGLNSIESEKLPSKIIGRHLKAITEILLESDEEPATIFQILSPEEQDAIEKLRAIIGPKQKRQKKAKRG